jgi:NADP-dependent aldehyde dehydrogenase
VPAGRGGDELVDAMRAAVTATPALVLLNGGIAAAYDRAVSRLRDVRGVEVLARGGTEPAEGFRATPALLATSAAALPVEVTEECFGPLTVVARYDSTDELLASLDRLPGSLTATIQRGADDPALTAELSRRLRRRAGRIIYDGVPTGVAVAWAQHHGGPWPSTNSQHTSVGVTALRRFLRPVAWQDAPADLLPDELTDDYRGIPRRIDGVLHAPD